ncbi:hypothetical protein [Nonomuraea dietziae]|uniref:Uncharacterized protein n=1 Tax=Nonomuraea dietziae TaxID=65515 RepID=A0A7W5YD31_9ACTN|nr:hypothetical protein [Nonomuraea dietziae]MBB3733056.1 hypothetical protein [Nonomuraea dietziae]
MKRFLAFLSSFLLVGSLAAPPAAAAAAAPRLKLSFGWCKTACEIRIKVTNTSRYDIAWVGGTCRLRVNGRYVGKGTVYLGPIKRGHSRSSTCNVVDSRLKEAWWDYENGDADFRTYATVKAIPHYRYRR